jgi:NitT/TauT family transport system ATP-binding protein
MKIEFTNTSLPDVVELKKCSISYDGKTNIVENIDFLIEDKPGQGQFDVILGPSGCGKSTLLRFIAGLQTPTSGEVLINGKPRQKSDIVSMVFQQYSSLPWYSVLENIMIPLKIAGKNSKECKEYAMHMIQKVGLDGHEHKFAQYPTLSGGQLQRVAIARCLISNPKILLMDEPFGALDAHTRFQMQVLLADIWLEFQPTIVFVTHDITEAVFLGDDIYMMSANPGTIVKHYNVPLPLKRDKMSKRDPRFIKLVQQIEDDICLT